MRPVLDEVQAAPNGARYLIIAFYYKQAAPMALIPSCATATEGRGNYQRDEISEIH